MELNEKIKPVKFQYELPVDLEVTCKLTIADLHFLINGAIYAHNQEAWAIKKSPGIVTRRLEAIKKTAYFLGVTLEADGK